MYNCLKQHVILRNITAICTFCFKRINALNAYRAKMWTFLLHQNRFADNFCFFSCLPENCEVSSPGSWCRCAGPVCQAGQSISRIVFMFPHVWGKMKIYRNRQLLEKILSIWFWNWLVFEMQIYAILELANLCVSLNFGGQHCNNNSLKFWL